MKTLSNVLIGASLASVALAAPGGLWAQTTVAGGGNLSRPPDQVGPDSRTWNVPGPGGPTASAGNQVVEIATGMNYWDGQQWSPSDASFVATSAGFQATRVQHQVSLSANLNVIGGVNIITPDGQFLSTTPVGIALYDAASGSTLFVGALTNCTGVLVGNNQVVYENAFSGVCASLIFTIEKGSFSQDLVLTGQLNPQDYGFPTATTRIQIYTEIYQGPSPDLVQEPLYIEPNPVVRQAMVSPDLIDETIGFGEFVLGGGRAYLMPELWGTNGTVASVVKAYKNVLGREFIVESVSYSAVQSAMATLPVCAPSGGNARLEKKGGSKLLLATIPSPPRVLNSTGTVQALAKQTSRPVAKPVGLTIDYIATIGGTINTNIVFAADKTYFVSDPVYCNGSATLESAVFKYQTNALLQFNSTVICRNGIYRPTFFTALDDDTIGDSLKGMTNYTGNINTNGYANPAIYVGTSSLSLSNCRFRYAMIAIQQPSASSSTTLTLTHAQLINCIRAIEINSSGSGSGSGSGTRVVNVNNVLMSAVQYPFVANCQKYPPAFTLAHCTVDQGKQLVLNEVSSVPTLCSSNSMFANITTTNGGSGTLLGGISGFYNASPSFGSSQLVVSASPFQSVGAGNYYLTDASGFRNAGTTSSVPTTLLADLAKRTTYPPLVISQAVYNTSQTLWPQAQRDTDCPDIGFHYDGLDYLINALLVTNATLTVTNGTALGIFGTTNGNYGLGIGQGGALVSQGAPNNPNWIVLYNRVQEQPANGWSRTTNGLLISEFQNLTPGSSIYCRFTDWSVPVQDAPAFYAPTNVGPFTFKDCEFYGGQLLSYRPTLNLTNCLLERVYSDLEPHDTNVSHVRSCEIYGGTFKAVLTNTAAWLADNLFDQATVLNSNNAYNGFNAYVTNGYTTVNVRLTPTNASDKVLGAPFAYQAGPLGNYYQLTNSVLVDAGNDWATNVGLYQYTVTTNLVSGLEIKEGSTKVNIGHHSVATDQYRQSNRYRQRRPARLSRRHQRRRDLRHWRP